jgi:HEAT repeat protein
MHVFWRGAPAAQQQAVYALRDLNDPRAIRPMVEHDPASPMASFEVLRRLCKRRAAPPCLTRLLRSLNPEIRWRAAYALAESGDPKLVPMIEARLTDPDSRVRIYSAQIAFSLPKRDYARIESRIRAMLDDPDRQARLNVAEMLAWRRDRACAPALLALAQDDTLQEWEHSSVVQAINNLTGSYFDYTIGSAGWRPTTAQNRAAIRRFAQWIRDNPEPTH